MAHYAKIEDGVVINVIVAEQDFIDTQDGIWVQTSYNTHFGEHLLGGTAPVAYPDDGGYYFWNEDTISWDVV